jgi:hypothetical protein
MVEYPWWQPFKSWDILEGQYRDLLTAAGCKSRGLQCLRSLTGEKLALAAQETYRMAYNGSTPRYGYGDYYYGPSVDNRTILGLPSREFAIGRFTAVRLRCVTPLQTANIL